MATITHEQLALAANTLRCLSIDAVQAAKSGHPGIALGLADVAAVLWLKYLKAWSGHSKWPDRDRFVLSGGHGSALLYSLLHLSGYQISIDDLKRFRQFGSKTPGHPEYGYTDGVETTTGPLGQGIANGVGMAVAERMLAVRFNCEARTVVDHRTWVFCGDGDMMEGISHEACSMAGHLGLEKLVMFYDSNNITIEGKVDLAMTDDTAKRFQAYGWHVLACNGHDFDDIDKTIRKATRLTGKPVLIICTTTIGKGSPNKANSEESHGAPLGEDEVRLTKTALGCDPDLHFHAPDSVYDLFQARQDEVKKTYGRWNRMQKAWAKEDKTSFELWRAYNEDVIPDLSGVMPSFDPAKPVATRSASGAVLNAIAPLVPQLVGGSADLGSSNMTVLKGLGDITAGAFEGRNFHFGVRELGMAGVMNGIAIHGGLRVYGATFFVFSDYCRPAMRIAALMGAPVVYVFSHDSFYVGEDGPTHEPVEQLAALRMMPGMTVIRPADATETVAAWNVALNHKHGPVALLLTRQNVPVLDRAVYPAAENLARGAYTLWQTRPEETPEMIIIATGSEVEIALEAAKAFTHRNVRVVSMPSWELFDEQPKAYRDSVLDPACAKRMAVEAGSSFGWQKYIGCDGATVCLDTFGASGPFKVLATQFGFTAENVLMVARTHMIAK